LSRTLSGSERSGQQTSRECERALVAFRIICDDAEDTPSLIAAGAATMIHRFTRFRMIVVVLSCGVLLPVALAARPKKADDGFVPLFDGKTLAGWKGDERLWKVEDGAIVGTSDGKLKHNTFLSLDKEFGDFALEASVKLEGGNSGIQFRSKQHDDFVVSGYQADFDDSGMYWGMLYEEKGRGILEQPKPELLKKAGVKKDDWNRYVITAHGDHITLELNGVKTVELVDPDGAKRGIIALQLHAGPPMTVRVKDLRLKELK
jgi:hypothetical protein